MTEVPDLARLIASRRPGYSLPAPFYLSREIYDLDLSLIFGRHWIFVGVEPEIPDAGDLFTVDIGTDSIIIVRDDDLLRDPLPSLFQGLRESTAPAVLGWTLLSVAWLVVAVAVRRAAPGAGDR